MLSVKFVLVARLFVVLVVAALDDAQAAPQSRESRVELAGRVERRAAATSFPELEAFGEAALTQPGREGLNRDSSRRRSRGGRAADSPGRRSPGQPQGRRNPALGQRGGTRVRADGREALDAYQNGGFDLVLMDMQMPVMDGLTATARIRAFETQRGWPRTPVLMLTANAMAEHIEAGRQAGADGHLSKPVTAATLFAAIS